MIALGKCATSRFRPLLHHSEIEGNQFRVLGTCGDHPVAITSSELERLRPVGRYVDGNRVFQVEEAQVLVQELDTAGDPIHGEVDLVACQEGTNDSEVLGEFLELHRLEAHHPHRRMSGTEAQKDPSRCEAIDRCDRVGGHRGDSGARDGDPRAQLDPGGGLGGQRHRGVAIRPDHLRIGKPNRVVTEFLGFHSQLPVIHFGEYRDADLHWSDPPLSRTRSYLIAVTRG